MGVNMTMTDVTVTTVSALKLAADQNRRYLRIQHKSAGGPSLYIKLGSAHSATEGIELRDGEEWEPHLVPVEAIYMVAASGSHAVNITSA